LYSPGHITVAFPALGLKQEYKPRTVQHWRAS